MRAELAFFKRVYGRHPFGRSSYGSEKTLELLNSEAAREFHQTVFIPNNVILVIAGDFDPKTIVDDITRRTANWKKSELPKLNLPPPLPRTRFVEELITLPDSAQLNIYMGQLGIRRSDPDYYKLLVMDHILGIGTGFTDRLSSKLRDRNGLAYEVTASITESAGEEPGVFKAYVGTYPDTLAEVKKMLLDEITRFRKDGPTDEEVAEARNYLIGSFAFRLATMHDVADELTHLERFDLGFDYYQRFRQEIVNVSAADVKAVAQKHLDPERMVFVAAGPIDRSGKALKK
jgi:zinc protease